MITPRPYQVNAIEALANCNLGYLKAPAGSGKTYCAAFAIKMRELRELRPLHVVWLAGTRELLDQGKSACDNVGLLGTQEFSCWQGLDRIPDCDILLCDECHGVAAPCYKSLLRTTLVKNNGKWSRRCITWGLSATPLREDEEPIEPIIGPCVYTIPASVVKEAGGVLPGVVKVIEFLDIDAGKLAESFAIREYRSYMNDDQRSRVLFRHVKKHCVTENVKRNFEAVKKATMHIANGDSVIVLVETVEQGKLIADKIEGAEVLHAKVSKKIRSERVERFRSGELSCIVATSLLDEGFDAKIANVLILARCGKATGRTIQRVGRVLRTYEDQTHGLIYDFKDLSHKMIEVQFYRRLKIFKSEGFRIESITDKKPA